MPIAPMLFAWQKFEDTLRNITIYSQRKELKRYIPKIRWAYTIYEYKGEIAFSKNIRIS